MLTALLAFAFGLLIGSFLNVCIYRLPQDLSVARPRSYCPACKHPIAWYDNVPLLSYALLGGHCRHCAARISWRYPVVEFLTGACFVLAVYPAGADGAAVRFCVLSALLIELVFSDVEERILPDEFTVGGTAAGLVFAWFVRVPPGFAFLLVPSSWGLRWYSLCDAVIGAVVASGAIWLVGALYFRLRHREGLGLGDVKMIAMIGAFLGLPATLFALIVGSVAGSLIGLLYILITRKSASTYELPFGSFLGAAALVVAAVTGPVSIWLHQAVR